jgi:hypothetical protein
MGSSLGTDPSEPCAERGAAHQEGSSEGHLDWITGSTGPRRLPRPECFDEVAYDINGASLKDLAEGMARNEEGGTRWLQS